MRSLRILLLVIVVAAIAGVAAQSASALSWEDAICPPDKTETIKVCPTGETGKAYSLQIKGRNGCWPFVKMAVIAGTLPPGLSFSSDGWITGTPTQAGVFDFWLQETDQIGGGGWCADSEHSERQFEITVLQGLQIQQRQSRLQTGVVSQAYSLQFSAVGGNPTWTLASGQLPAGLSLSSSGMLSGTPTTEGDYHFQVQAADGDRTDTQTYDMAVVQQLKVAGVQAPGELGEAYSVQLNATGGRAPYTWSATGLPAGLTLDPAKGTVSGTPTAVGNATVKITVTDALGEKTTNDLSASIAARLALVSTPLRGAKVGVAYHGRIATVGGVAPRTFTVASGKLPAGLRLNASTGAITGKAKKAGTAHFRVSVTDKLGVAATKAFVLRVK